MEGRKSARKPPYKLTFGALAPSDWRTQFFLTAVAHRRPKFAFLKNKIDRLFELHFKHHIIRDPLKETSWTNTSTLCVRCYYYLDRPVRGERTATRNTTYGLFTVTVASWLCDNQSALQLSGVQHWERPAACSQRSGRHDVSLRHVMQRRCCTMIARVHI